MVYLNDVGNNPQQQLRVYGRANRLEAEAASHTLQNWVNTAVKMTMVK